MTRVKHPQNRPAAPPKLSTVDAHPAYSGLQNSLTLQIRPVDLLKELHVRQRILAAGAERLASADLLDEMLRFALVAPAPDRLAEGRS